MQRRTIAIAALIVAVACLGFLLGWWVCRLPAMDTFGALRVTDAGLRFTQPLLAVGEDPRLRLLQQEEAAARSVIQRRQADGSVRDVSVYVKDFNSSTWGGVDEDQPYVLASLHKVILMIALLKQSEDNPALFGTSLVYDNPEPLRYGDETNTSPDPIKEGQRYLIGDLITRMIVYSDNNAKDLLAAVVDRATLERTYRDLGLEVQAKEDVDDTMSARAFSLYFRVLYNASYVSRALSEEALSILSQAVFKDGLVAGVPEGVPVAHKFGHRILQDSGLHELHDCGIIYYPGHPYALCVMTRGSAYEGLRDTIADVSRAVYERRAAALR